MLFVLAILFINKEHDVKSLFRSDKHKPMHTHKGEYLNIVITHDNIYSRPKPASLWVIIVCACACAHVCVCICEYVCVCLVCVCAYVSVCLRM